MPAEHRPSLAEVERCIAFAHSIGIPAKIGRRQWQNEFLPGLLVWRGVLFINPDHVLGYDDILHELGHLAILPSTFRRHATGDIDRSIWRPVQKYRRAHPFMIGHEEDPIQRAVMQASDHEAIAWSFAAMTELKLPVRLIVDGGPDAIAGTLCQLGTGYYCGINGLAAAGMTTTRTFPKMLRWAQP